MAVRAGRQQDRALLKRVGRRVLWQQAILCPCQQYDGTQGPPCTACERGYLYQPAQGIQALMTSDNRRESYDIAGAWEEGTAYATVAAHVDIGQWDKLIVQDFPIRDSLIQTRAASGSKDAIRQAHLVDLLVVRDKDTTYTNGADYRLSADASGDFWVEWLASGKAPLVGASYSLLCTIKMLWIVQGHAFIRGLTGKRKHQLPKRVRLLRHDLAAEGAKNP